MDDDVVTSVECAACGASYDDGTASSARAGERPGCATCGADGIKVNVLVQETITMHERVDLKARHEGQGRPFIEQRVGDDLHRASGTWSKVRRVIDRVVPGQYRYIEHVIDHKGTVVRDIDVPLSEHRGHGDDTSQPKAHP
jgi:hypothetical protein